ncbi:MAG: esterase-like activity of phytase family protein [Chloroflexota bacterium]
MTRKFVMVVFFALLVLPFAAQDDAPVSLEFIGEFNFPAGSTYETTFIGGLSSIDYDPATETYYVISDDRIESGPARFYTVDIDFDALGINDVVFTSVTEILKPDGTSFGELGADPEGMRYVAANNTLLWSHERDENGNPFVGEINLDGTPLRSFTLPDYYFMNEDGTQGAADNAGFESLTLSADGTQVIAGIEAALLQDGPLASLDAGSPSRVLVFDYESGEPVAEYVYMNEAIPIQPEPADGFALNGVVEMYARPDGTFYSLERAFAAGVGHVGVLYVVDFEGATNVLGEPTLAGLAYTPATKTPVLTIPDENVDVVDNVEGITFGPEVDGRRTLLINSDDNFSPFQNSQFLAYFINE